MSFVYWIHLPEHTDITCEGYIGVTSKKSANERFKQHVNLAEKGSNTILSKAIRKHSVNLVLTVLVDASDDYCYEIEHKLRPSDRVGWNTVAGGGKPPVHVKHTEEAKRKIGEASKRTSHTLSKLIAYAESKGRKHSEIAKSKMKEKAKGRKPWETSRADKSLWANAAEVYELLQQNPSFGYIKLGQMLGVSSKYSLEAMYLKFKKQNWNPLQDPEWLAWIQTYQI